MSTQPIDLFRAMLRIRLFEEQVIKLFKASEFSGFLHTGIGQEAIAVGVCSVLRADDWITATHRSHGHLLAKGVPMGPLLAEIFGKTNGLCGGVAGHVHVADLERKVVGGNGILGQNQPIAGGLALGLTLRRRDSVVVSFFGDGTANEGAVHEAMNLAAIWNLPVLFLCERNEFAELSPFASQFKTQSIASRAVGYGFSGHTVDGSDVEKVGELVLRIVNEMRAGAGPALVEARVVRWHGHYEGDPQQYRDITLSRTPDPLTVLADRYPEALGADTRIRIEAEALAEVNAAVQFARSGEYPRPSDVFRDALAAESAECGMSAATTSSSADTVKKKYRLAIRDALAEEMESNPDVILMGQDIGAADGLFKLTEGLFERFGPERVRDTPISETATVGAAIGLAMLGFRPVVEIAFSDLMLTCFDTIVNQLAKIKWMFGTQGPDLPVVIRALTGAGLGVGAHHSQSLEALFAHMPGLNVLTPATPNDAAGLLRAALRCRTPSIFLEHKLLLRDTGPVRSGEVATFGQALVTTEGTEITLVGYAYTAKLALQAATALLDRGISAETVDLRTVAPLDIATVVESARKTGRLLVVQEAYKPFGVGAEVLAAVASAGVALKGPPERLAVPFMPIPALKVLEVAYLPTVEKIVTVVNRMCRASSAGAV